jgi:hypothetical protein
LSTEMTGWEEGSVTSGPASTMAETFETKGVPGKIQYQFTTRSGETSRE